MRIKKNRINIRYLLFPLLVLCAIQFSFGCNQAPVGKQAKAKKAGANIEETGANVLKLSSENSITSEYSFRFYTSEIGNIEAGYGAFEILHKGERVYYEAGRRYSVKTAENDDYAPVSGESLKIKDITGDGIPELIIGVWSGGAHCCFSTIIFSLGEEFKKIAEIDGGDTSFDFKNFEGDGIYELVGRDWTFAYWKTSFVNSPAPQIILRYMNGKYIIASDLMRKQSPSQKEIEANLAEIKEKFARPGGSIRPDPTESLDDEVPPELWGDMLDLIYTGNGKTAIDFFNKAWPDHKKGKEEFLAAFKMQLSKSKYWQEIKVFSRWE